MRNLEASQHLENPSLIEIKAVSLGSTRLNEFTMTIAITRPKEDTDRSRAAKTTPIKG
jgi:hypothetical protein